MIKKVLSFIRDFGKMGKRMATVYTSMALISLCITKDIGKMTWKMVKEGWFSKMASIQATGTMTKNTAKENLESKDLKEL